MDEDEIKTTCTANPLGIKKGMLVRPVVFFSDWIGVVISDPRQYEPDESYHTISNEEPFLGVAYWMGVACVDVYWFTEGMASEEFVDFLEIVSPPQDIWDDPDYDDKKWDFHWVDEDTE